MRWILPILLAATPLTAQDRQGNDTPGDWIVTHFATFGLWSSICDERIEDGTLRQRCYIRWVDVYSPRPDFAAQFLFITPETDGPSVEFGIEPGTFFAPDGFRITHTPDDVIWSTTRGGCLTGLSCVFSGPEVEPLLSAMQTGTAFRFTFTDRHGRAQDLTWPLIGFDAAFSDFETQSRSRNLPSR
ncbi:hypothetical protein ACS3QZ_01780 [Shimia sp. W99]